jgi:serine/threonine protein kinase
MPPDSPAGLCLDCLFGAGLEVSDPEFADLGQTEARKSAGFVPPKPHELADRFPQFEIIDLLGYGGMGAVYKARQKSLDRLVALKIIKPDAADDRGFAERFAREARALARLNHANIVSIFDFGEATSSTPLSTGGSVEKLYYFVMEYVDGTNLRHLIETKELPSDQAIQIIPQVCEALQFAHDEKIVHRDIKPENILVDSRGRVKIADFGLAKLLGKGSVEDHTLTGTHQVMGTPRYMAPEQMEGAHAVDHRADIYSLGVVFYEMLTGEIPMGSFEPPSKKAHVDVRLDDVVLRSLAKEPERRYQNASDIGSAVESIAQSEPRFQPDDAKYGEQQVAGFATSASFAADEETAEQDGLRTAVLFILFFGSVLGVVSMFMPWSEVRIESLDAASSLQWSAMEAQGYRYACQFSAH